MTRTASLAPIPQDLFGVLRAFIAQEGFDVPTERWWEHLEEAIAKYRGPRLQFASANGAIIVIRPRRSELPGWPADEPLPMWYIDDSVIHKLPTFVDTLILVPSA